MQLYHRKSLGRKGGVIDIRYITVYKKGTYVSLGILSKM